MSFVKRMIKEHIHDESAFRLIYIVSLMMSFLCVVELPAQIFSGIVLAWGAYLLIRRFINKTALKTDYAPLLLLFLAIGLVAATLHIRDHFGMNLLMLFHAAVCFFLFFGLHAESDKKTIKEEMLSIFRMIVWFATICSVLGLLLALFTTRFFVGTYVFGLSLMDNRFTGVYTNPNLAAFVSAVAMVCCHFLMAQKKGLLPKWLCVLCFTSNTFALFLSDSNASLVFLCVYSGILLLYYVLKQSWNLPRAKVLMRGAAACLGCVLITAGGFALRTACQQGVAFTSNFLQSVTQEKRDVPKQNGAAVSGNSAGGNLSIGRHEDYEVSSGRLDSLRKAMQLFRRFPLLGVGKANIVEYGERFLTQGFLYSDLHNGYLTILISCGAVGLAVFLVFLGCVLLRFAKALYVGVRFSGTDKELPILFAAVAAYCVYGLFEKAVLFDITFMVVVFWMLLGYAVNGLKQQEWQRLRFRLLPRPAFPAAVRYPSGVYGFSGEEKLLPAKLQHKRDA
jgi:hypothetical protein